MEASNWPEIDSVVRLTNVTLSPIRQPYLSADFVRGSRLGELHDSLVPVSGWVEGGHGDGLPTTWNAPMVRSTEPGINRSTERPCSYHRFLDFF